MGKKIVMITTLFPPIQSGVGNYVHQLSLGISKTHDVIIYTFNWNNPKKYEEEKIGGILIKRFKFWNVLYHYNISFDMIREIKKDCPDLIHAHHYGYFPSIAGLLASKLFKIPYVFSLYFHPPIYSRFNSFLFWIFYWSQGRYTLTKADMLLPCSQKEKEYLVSLGAKKNKIKIVPLIVNSAFYRPIKTVSTKKKIVLYVGALNKGKGIDHFLEMAEAIIIKRDDCLFFIIGADVGNKQVKKAVSYSRGRIKYLGRAKSNEDLRREYSKAYILVSPSYYESFGLVIAEAMSCGTPVISTKRGAIPEVVITGKTGLLSKYGDIAQMTNDVEYLLDNPIIAKKMGKVARNHIVLNFNKKLILSKHLKIYEHFLNIPNKKKRQ